MLKEEWAGCGSVKGRGCFKPRPSLSSPWSHQSVAEGWEVRQVAATCSFLFQIPLKFVPAPLEGLQTAKQKVCLTVLERNISRNMKNTNGK